MKKAIMSRHGSAIVYVSTVSDVVQMISNERDWRRAVAIIDAFSDIPPVLFCVAETEIGVRQAVAQKLIHKIAMEDKYARSSNI